MYLVVVISGKQKYFSLAISNSAIHLLSVDCMSKRTERAETVFVRVLQNSKYVKCYSKTRAVYVIPTGFHFRSSDKNYIVLHCHATRSVDIKIRAFIDQQDSSLTNQVLSRFTLQYFLT